MLNTLFDILVILIFGFGWIPLIIQSAPNVYYEVNDYEVNLTFSIYDIIDGVINTFAFKPCSVVE